LTEEYNKLTAGLEQAYTRWEELAELQDY